MSSPQRGQPMPRNRASLLQFPQTSPGRSSLTLHLLLTADFGSFKAKNSTQPKTKLLNLDLSQLLFFFFFKCKLEIKNYRNCYALVTSTAVENSHPALDPNGEQVLHTAFALKNQMNFPMSYQEALMKHPLLE